MDDAGVDQPYQLLELVHHFLHRLAQRLWPSDHIAIRLVQRLSALGHDRVHQLLDRPDHPHPYSFPLQIPRLKSLVRLHGREDLCVLPMLVDGKHPNVC